MEVQTIVITDLDRKVETDLNYNQTVSERRMYDFNYNGKLTFIKFKDILPINPVNDALMTAMSYRATRIDIDRSIFKKSHDEKLELKRLKKENKKSLSSPKHLNNKETCEELLSNFNFYNKRPRGLGAYITNFVTTNLG